MTIASSLVGGCGLNHKRVTVRGSQSHVEMVLGNFHVKGHDRSVADNGVVQD